MKAIKENQRNKHECKKRLNQKEKGRPERGTTTWNTEDTQQTQTQIIIQINIHTEGHFGLENYANKFTIIATSYTDRFGGKLLKRKERKQ